MEKDKSPDQGYDAAGEILPSNQYDEEMRAVDIQRIEKVYR